MGEDCGLWIADCGIKNRAALINPQSAIRIPQSTDRARRRPLSFDESRRAGAEYPHAPRKPQTPPPRVTYKGSADNLQPGAEN